MSRLLSGILIICLASFLLSGCGQKGPLFLTDDQLSEMKSEDESTEENQEEATY